MHVSRFRLLCLLLLVAGLTVGLCLSGQSAAPVGALSLEQKAFVQGKLYVLTVPAGTPLKVIPLTVPGLARVEAPAWRSAKGKKPVFLINGGFFDPNNGLTTSFVFEDGILTGDPLQNPSLMGNEKLKPYLPKILNRPEFRTYLCRKPSGEFEGRYDIVKHSAPVPVGCVMEAALGAGPTLVPSLEDVEEGFVDYNAAGKRIRDPIGVCAKNARSAVGLTGQGDVILVMAAQLPQNPAKTGFTLADIAALLKARGAVKAMALDGGSSSSLLFNGKPVYGKFNKDATPVKRPVKSILMVVPR